MIARRFVAVVALTGLLAFAGTPAGAVCAWTGGGQHGCCASKDPEPHMAEGSCCGDMASKEEIGTPSPPEGCDCLHAPEAPAGLTVGTPTSHDGQTAASFPGETRMVSDGTLSDRPTDRARFRGGGHDPPIFLALCAFLT